MTRYLRGLALLMVVGLAVGTLASQVAVAEKLPVFRLAKPTVDRGKATRLLQSITKGKLPPDAKLFDEHGVVGHRAGQKTVEIHKPSGGIFLADFEHLWNPRRRPALPSKANAKRSADRFLSEHKLLPPVSRHVKVAFKDYSETGVGVDVEGKVEKHILDVHVNYGVDIAVRRGGKDVTLATVGGGGKFKVAIGEGGSVIGFHGAWRPIEAVESEEEILPQAEAEGQFRKMAGNLKVTKTESFLAYYSAPAFEEQAYLAPVWVVKAEAEIDGEKVPLRNTIIAATKYGPWLPEIPAKARPKDEQPRPDSLDKDEPSRPQQSGWFSRFGRFVSELLTPGTASAAPAFEAGTSWIGPSQGLGGSPANAKGFVDGLSAAGWTINFNWGELAAWESDWRRNDDSWVDAADFVFYTGHANSSGWVLNNPDDTFLHYTEVQAAGSDLYGNTDVEWIIIAACGPHQSSHFVGNVGNAFDRWRGSFDGLHVFLGYGAVTYDNTSEGKRVVQLARAGWPIIDAWFRTAWEIQPSTNGYGAPDGPTIYVTAMYAHMGDHATRNDHIWGTGTTVSDPVGSGQQRYLMWSGT